MLKVLVLLLAMTGVAHAAVEVGQQAPALKGQMLDGKAFDLAAMKGKVVLVHYWATWCAPCKEEMPQVDAYFRKHHGEGLEIVAISIDRAREVDKVKDALKPFAFPGAMMTDLVESGFGMPKEIPETFVVDQDGVVRAVLLPDPTILSEQDLSKVVSPILRR